MQRTDVFIEKKKGKKNAPEHKYYIKRSAELPEHSHRVKWSLCESVLQALKSARELKGDSPEIKTN